MKSIDSYTIVTILLTIPVVIHATEQLIHSIIHSIIRWQKMRMRDVSFQIEIKNTEEIENTEEIQQKINAMVEEIHQKFTKNVKKHDK